MHLLTAAQLADGCREVFLRHAGILKNLGGRAVAAHDSEEHKLQRDELVALLLRQFLCAREYIICFAREIRLTALHARQALQLSFESLADGLFTDRQLTKQELSDLLARLHDGSQQVLRLDGLLTAGLSRAHGLLHSLLRFDGKLVDVHDSDLLFNNLLFTIFPRPANFRTIGFTTIAAKGMQRASPQPKSLIICLFDRRPTPSLPPLPPKNHQKGRKREEKET